jgi:hypothetical protein
VVTKAGLTACDKSLSDILSTFTFLPDCIYHQNLDGHNYSRIITDVVLNQTLNQSIYLTRVLMRRLARSKHPSLIHIKINKILFIFP